MYFIILSCVRVCVCARIYYILIPGGCPQIIVASVFKSFVGSILLTQQTALKKECVLISLTLF